MPEIGVPVVNEETSLEAVSTTKDEACDWGKETPLEATDTTTEVATPISDERTLETVGTTEAEAPKGTEEGIAEEEAGAADGRDGVAEGVFGSHPSSLVWAAQAGAREVRTAIARRERSVVGSILVVSSSLAEMGFWGSAACRLYSNSRWVERAQ